MRAFSDIGFPRLPLLGAFAAVGISLIGAAAGSVSRSHGPTETGTALASRDLIFEDRADGAVVAREAGDLHTVEVFEGENGFLRGTLRGLARTRKAEQVGPAVPFRLARWPDGRLTLDDPATGHHVELLAFGPTNAAVFAHLLTAPEHQS